MLNFASIAAEFDLGHLVAATPMAGGYANVTRITTDRGMFVIKRGFDESAAELYEQAADLLNAAGIRQAQPLRSRAGSLLSRSGHVVQEFLPGRAYLRPTSAQAIATMRHAGEYHAVLAQLQVQVNPLKTETVWSRVASAEYLVAELPALLRTYGWDGIGDDRDVRAALRHVENGLAQIRELPIQLVHGDIGPDNVLMAGDEVVAIIDFAPFFEPVMFAIATAVYWYHIHGHRQLDVDAIHASFAAAGHREWTAVERATWPTMLAREALRRLATPIALAAETGADNLAAGLSRYRAVLSLMESWRQLQHAAGSAG